MRIGLTVLAIAAASVSQAAEPFRYPEKAHAHGELKYVNGLPVLVLQGTPAEMGAAAAELGVRPAERLLGYPREFFELGVDALPKKTVERLWREALVLGEHLWKQAPEPHRQELAALQLHSDPEHRDTLLAANTLFDIKKVVACSALIVEKEKAKLSADTPAGPLLGRNLDFPTLDYLQDYSLVLVFRQPGKKAFACVGFPGLVGVLSGMNQDGLALGVLEIYRCADGSPSFDRDGVPYALLLRRVLEECATVDEAQKLLEGARRTTRFNLAICDRNGGGVLEITPRQVKLRRPQDGLCPCTNHFLVPGLADEEQDDRYRTLSRFRVLNEAAQLPRLGVEEVQKRLHAANLGRSTLQTMIFEPASLRLHLAIGPCPTSQLPMKTLELGEWLKR